jgi:F-type H+-transporting ATPase subunit epsilon
MAQTFQCSLVTPENAVFDRPTIHVELPAHDGQIGLMYQRAPLVCKLGVGRLRLTSPENQQVDYLIDGGFAEMKDNRLSVLTERAVPGDQIDTEQARAAFAEAQALRPETDELFDKRQHDLAVARTMLEIAG